MKYIIDIPNEKLKRISQLISEGRYDNISQFTLTAVENQLLLEESSEERLDRVIATPLTQERKLNNIVKVRHEELLSTKFTPSNIQTVSPPTLDRIPNDVLWGQYNRIFPVKITMRVLANLLSEKKLIDLALLHSQAISAAREIGIMLKKKDEEQGRKYGNMLSAALPTGKSVLKAENRFMNHFVGYLTRAGRIEGAPGALKLLNIFDDPRGVSKVGITKEGLLFASLENPVMDRKQFGATLGENERDFYLRHIKENLEREKEAMFLVMKGIKEGVSSPSELNSKIGVFSRGWSEAMTNTIRAGIASRLVELGLIDRQRDGIRVKYVLTDFGTTALASFEKEERV